MKSVPMNTDPSNRWAGTQVYDETITLTHVDSLPESSVYRNCVNHFTLEHERVYICIEKILNSFSAHYRHRHERKNDTDRLHSISPVSM